MSSLSLCAHLTDCSHICLCCPDSTLLLVQSVHTCSFSSASSYFFPYPHSPQNQSLVLRPPARPRCETTLGRRNDCSKEPPKPKRPISSVSKGVSFAADLDILRPSAVDGVYHPASPLTFAFDISLIALSNFSVFA